MIYQSGLPVSVSSWQVLKSLVNWVSYANEHLRWPKSFQEVEGYDSGESDTIISGTNRFASVCMEYVNTSPV